MTFWQKLLQHAREMYYRHTRLWMNKNPRKGKCEACGHTHTKKGKPIRSQIHHWRYAYPTSEVRKNHNLALHYTSELCYRCHRYADALRRFYDIAKRHPKIAQALVRMARTSIDDFDEVMEGAM